jgi:integrase
LVTLGEVIEAWTAAGCPNVAPSSRSRHARRKSAKTIENVDYSVRVHLAPELGRLRVDRTSLERVEERFGEMADAGYATSTIHHAWLYLNQACQFGVRRGMTTTNPAADVLLPEVKTPKERKSFTIEQARRLLFEVIPQDTRPAMWMTGLMCGLRPGELTGLRWPSVTLEGDEPMIWIAERANELNQKYIGQAEPKTRRKGAIGLHPLVAEALRCHPEGFVFCTRNRTPMALHNVRRSLRRLCDRAGLSGEWTTYELRHSFASLVSDQIDDLVKVADLMGHASTRSTQGYRHRVRTAMPHAVSAWSRLLEEGSADAGSVGSGRSRSSSRPLRGTTMRRPSRTLGITPSSTSR